MPASDPVISVMTAGDAEDALELWRQMQGIGLDDEVDNPQGIASYLERNPGMSFVARLVEESAAGQKGKMVAAVMCGHDGRRGYLHHLAVDSTMRGRGIGRELVERCLSALLQAGIVKCHLFVYTDNHAAQQFWKKLNWRLRNELVMMTKDMQ